MNINRSRTLESEHARKKARLVYYPTRRISKVLPGHGGIWVVRCFGGVSSVFWGDSSGQRRQLNPNGARQLGSPSPPRAQCVVNRKPNLQGSEPQSLWLSKTRVRARRRRVSHATQGHDQIRQISRNLGFVKKYDMRCCRSTKKIFQILL